MTAEFEILHSPFRYPGGKFYARRMILECIPMHEGYCEPFTGGGSIFFAKMKTKRNVLNDLDIELVNCYLHIRDHVEDLINLLDGISATKELHSFYKNEYKPKNDLERAFRWFYLNRISYSGIMRMQNCYFGYGEKYSMRPENWAKHLRKVSQKLQDVQIFCLDFEKLLEQIDKDLFLFVDPPYFNADQDKFYNVTFGHDDHIRLAKVLKEANLKFLLTYDDCVEIRELYRWCTIVTKEWFYTISRTDDQKNGKGLKEGYSSNRKKGKELFIANYLLPQRAITCEHKKVLQQSRFDF